MRFSNESIVEIICKSSFIVERKRQNFIFNGSSQNNFIITSRLEKWCQRVAHGNWQEFEKYLAWEGLDLNTLHTVLVTFSKTDDNFSLCSVLDSLPAWAETLKLVIQTADEIYAEILDKNNISNYFCLDTQQLVPFEELLLPFIQVARQKLVEHKSSNYSLLLKTAHNILERGLLKQLSTLASPAMELQFSSFRHFQKSSLTHLLKPNQDNLYKEQYEAFIRSMLSGKLISFFQEYTVLARLLAVATDLWVDATGEFIQRLASDWSKTQEYFQPEQELGQVTYVEPALSDPHNNGQSVIAIEFTSGLKLIYKPKDLGTEQAYFKLLEWCNNQNKLLPFKLLRVLNFSTHGWVEFVEHLPCKNTEEAKHYYQRSGMLLCLVHVLKGTDCNAGNIIACGEHPVLIDEETLLHHRLEEEEKQEEEAEIQSVVNQHLWNSVLRTGFLPQWHLGNDKQAAYDLSGLGAVDDNVPSLNGVKLLPEDYVEDILTGFRQMYQFLMDYRDAILATDGPLAPLAQQKVRFIFRNTSVYDALLQKIRHPKFLRDGADFSIEFEILSRPLLISDSKPFFWDLLRVEKQALSQLDVPYFSAYTDSNSLNLSSNQTIDNFFKEPSYDLVVSYLKQLNDADLEREIGFIRSSLCSRMMPQMHTLPLSVKSDVNLVSMTTLTREEIMGTVKTIAAEVKQQAICANDDSKTWIALAYRPEAQKYQLQAMNYGLYDGSCGVALFLAALEKVTGGSGFRELILGVLKSIHQNFKQPKLSQRIVKKIGIGGGLGLGSIIYTLVRSSEFLDEPNLLKDAKHIASLITPELVAADKKFDIIFGSAGAILGLLALYKTSGDLITLEKAISCGYHLLNHRVESDSRYKAWATLNGNLLTGMSHGASGIAYALIQLYTVTKEPIFREAAEEAISYEKSVFSSQANNWPDFRVSTNYNGSSTFADTWCNGASGIGLARLGGLAILDTDDIRQDIEIALQTTLNCSLDGIDHLCCGTFGRIEFLLAASRQLSRMDLLETAQEQAAWVVARAKKVGSFSLMPGFNKNVYLPGFFQGITGIGYELLRLTYPDLLPSVLLWE
ncbi:type 2 lanthipeptide synthetase LanM family protein [Nostoc sp. FACHB-133]|uniref:type 2 lanthipeptide synthetase LanM family protein n=1 Tax=Nostoc sp. FACHB-133 TaxID=2692835 RepID=UPI0016852C8F|nr:type 2 lanthipeptide synthetase LanM family protein [Nostoc sp. FACHB-133]MBD2526764.1 type 2 lantipeptide synthetase LanM [Nostoc sp. FACHB-133]